MTVRAEFATPKCALLCILIISSVILKKQKTQEYPSNASLTAEKNSDRGPGLGRDLASQMTPDALTRQTGRDSARPL